MKRMILSMVVCASVNSMAGMENPYVYGVVEAIGVRPAMEDEIDVHINDDHEFYAVYDGHGGKTVATIAKFNLYKMCQLAHANTNEEIVAALRNGFLTLQQGLSDALLFPGSTATVAVIKNGNIFVANAGDSRTVLCSNGIAIPLSKDHKPNRPDEKKRIEDLGGQVIRTDTWRVEGSLAVSRALGDKYLHPFVIAEPEITVRALNPQDEFLILACDGVWDVLSNQYAVNDVRDTLSSSNGNCILAARLLAHEALRKKSTDNISAIVVNLKSFFQE